MIQKSTPKWPKNGPKMVPKWDQKLVQKRVRIRGPSWSRLGAVLRPSWDHFWTIFWRKSVKHCVFLSVYEVKCWKHTMFCTFLLIVFLNFQHENVKNWGFLNIRCFSNLPASCWSSWNYKNTPCFTLFSHPHTHIHTRNVLTRMCFLVPWASLGCLAIACYLPGSHLKFPDTC